MPSGPWNLWAAQREGVDAERAEIDGDFADGLRGVGVDEHAVLAAVGGDFGDRLEDARFVVGEHDADEADAHRTAQEVEVSCVDNAVVVCGERVDLPTAKA